MQTFHKALRFAYKAIKNVFGLGLICVSLVLEAGWAYYLYMEGALELYFLFFLPFMALLPALAGWQVINQD